VGAHLIRNLDAAPMRRSDSSNAKALFGITRNAVSFSRRTQLRGAMRRKVFELGISSGNGSPVVSRRLRRVFPDPSSVARDRTDERSRSGAGHILPCVSKIQSAWIFAPNTRDFLVLSTLAPRAWLGCKQMRQAEDAGESADALRGLARRTPPSWQNTATRDLLDAPTARSAMGRDGNMVRAYLFWSVSDGDEFSCRVLAVGG